MIHILIIAFFILTCAITWGSIVVSSHLKSAYKSDYFSTLIFYLVFYFTFGFYALWGQLIMASFLTPYISETLLFTITDLMVLLGTPFLVFASFMFVRFSREIAGRKSNNRFIVWYLLVNVFIIAGFGFAASRQEHIKALTLMRYYFILLSFLFTLSGVYYLIFPGNKQARFRYSDFSKLSTGLIVFMIIENVLLLFYDIHILLSLLFIFSYFVYGGFLPFYIKYKTDLSGLMKDEIPVSYEHFYEKHAISPREKEIIHEICKGLSNQQIADTLFISLQTVKDHTHRIYSKTECSSRAQLIRMVNEIQ